MKRLLCIDGGGVRGVVPSIILAELERRLYGRIAASLDMIGGTSTGGLIALALASPRGLSAANLASLYLQDVPGIFPRIPWWKYPWILTHAAYSPTPLANVIAALTGDATLAAARIPVLVSTKNLTTNVPEWITSYAEKTWTFVEAGLATAAAPVGFPWFHNPITGQDYADGGLWCPNPSLFALLEARDFFADPDIYVLSLGTGTLDSIPEPSNQGVTGWALPYIENHSQAQAYATDSALQRLLPADHYDRCSPPDHGNTLQRHEPGQPDEFAGADVGVDCGEWGVVRPGSRAVDGGLR